jgi:unsaturated rhamnogalacturonyl hydrolase
MIAAIVEATARTKPTIWGFGVGGSLTALMRAALVDHVADLVAPSLSAVPGPADHLISVEVLQVLARERPHLDIGAACQRWLSAVLGASRPEPTGPRVHRPDLAPWRSTIWVDCMHTDGPGLAALGLPDEAVAYAEEYASALQRDDGLFHHGYDVSTGRGNGVAWGRGQAWALLGLVDTLRLANDAGLRSRLDRLVDAIATHERDGFWHTIVDDPAAPVEASVSAYVAYGVARAVRSGLIDPSYRAMADRAWACTVAGLRDGALEVSEATPVGDPADYQRRATGVFPWGQAPVLHAALDREVIQCG